ncbi:hypothetical protein AFE02nite_28430 [Actinotalea fermentans]|uniref:Uncharacterized protein n=1 Tax=Actinotalea fermentans TaxID=43671 RepID=A0A511Z0Z3_9CELL|nr:hypothetical protein AFE02nite_28430 [Actinotalea fermentans]
MPVAGSTVYVPCPGTATETAGFPSPPTSRTEPPVGTVTVVCGDCGVPAEPPDDSGGAVGAGGASTVGVYRPSVDWP